MKITAPQQIIDKSIKVAESFSDKPDVTGRISYNTAILIEADKDAGTVKFTAANEKSAIEFIIKDDVKVEESGTVLVPAIRLKVAISNLTAGEDVTIKSAENEIVISAGKRRVSLAILPIENPTLVPRVGTASDEGVEFRTEDFVTGFKSGAAAAESGESTVASNVYIKFDSKEALFITHDSKSANLKRVPTTGGSATIEALVNRQLLGNSIEQISMGDKVVVSHGKSGADINVRETHFVVTGDGVYRHVRITSHAHDVSSFRAESFKKAISDSVDSAAALVVVNKKDFLATLRAADNICALNSNSDKRDLHIEVAKSGITVSVDNRDGFSEEVDVKSLNGEVPRFALRYNNFTGLFDSYPAARDELIIAVSMKDNSFKSITLIDDESFSLGDPSEDLKYFALAAASKV